MEAEDGSCYMIRVETINMWRQAGEKFKIASACAQIATQVDELIFAICIYLDKPADINGKLHQGISMLSLFPQSS